MTSLIQTACAWSPRRYHLVLSRRGGCTRGRGCTSWQRPRTGGRGCCTSWQRPRAGGCSSLWGRARLLEAVGARGVHVGDAHVASLHGAGAGVPVPPPLGRPACPGCYRVDVRVDIGLCIRRRHPDSWSQNAHARDDQSAFHRFLLLDESSPGRNAHVKITFQTISFP